MRQGTAALLLFQLRNSQSYTINTHSSEKQHYWNLHCNRKQRCSGHRESLILHTLKHTRRWHNWNTAHSQHSTALLWRLRNSHCSLHWTHSLAGKKYCKQRQRCHDIWEILISQVEAECRYCSFLVIDRRLKLDSSTALNHFSALLKGWLMNRIRKYDELNGRLSWSTALLQLDYCKAGTEDL